MNCEQLKHFNIHNAIKFVEYFEWSAFIRWYLKHTWIDISIFLFKHSFIDPNHSFGTVRALLLICCVHDQKKSMWLDFVNVSVWCETMEIKAVYWAQHWRHLINDFWFFRWFIDRLGRFQCFICYIEQPVLFCQMRFDLKLHIKSPFSDAILFLLNCMR